MSKSRKVRGEAIIKVKWDFDLPPDANLQPREHMINALKETLEYEAMATEVQVQSFDMKVMEEE